jgi:hypothetical protein
MRAEEQRTLTATHIWTTFSRGDRDFDRDIDKRSRAAQSRRSAEIEGK